MRRLGLLELLVGASMLLVIGLISLSGQLVLAQTPADVDALAITDFPENVESFIDFSFTIEAQDSNEEVVSNYNGTVKFYSDTDPNAELPPEYTFTAEDNGQKEFTESYFFTQTGAQELTVEDVDDPDLSTTVTINVSDELSGEEETIELSAPTPGETTNSTITVRGQTTPGVNVTILNGEEVLGTVDADAEGNFEFQTGVLPDGNYQIQATTDNAESEVIDVTINTEAPLVDFFEAEPETAPANSTIDVTVSLQEEAREVRVFLNNVQTALTKDSTNPRVFRGTVGTPATAGEYQLTLQIEDELGNVANNVPTETTITVTAATDDDQTPALSVPGQVTGVQAQASDRRITLSWQPAPAQAGIQNYAIYYGTDPGNLAMKVETNDESTTWFIPNLTNDQQYYLQVFAIDNNGNRSDQGSQIIAATPNLAAPTTLHGSAAGQVTVNQTSETGPGGLAALALGSLFGAKFIRRRKQ